MKKNAPYVKKYEKTKDANGIEVKGKVLNPITKENPYLHHVPSTRTQKRRFKYRVINNFLTGEFIGEVKVGGNNRKKCKRTGKKRLIHFNH